MGIVVRRAGWALAGITLAALTGCNDLANSRLDFSATEKAAITEIQISGGDGDVTIRGGGTPGQVTIARVVRYRGDEPGRTYRVTGSELSIDTDCGRVCSVSYEIEVPEGVAVRGENGSGDLRLTGVAEVDVEAGSGGISVTDSSGDVTVGTGSGDIRVRSVAGSLTASAGSGGIDARDVSGGSAQVKTGSGDVTLALDRPADVRGEVGSGNLTVTVPAGRYRVQTSTGSGDANVGVTQDPTAEHLLDLDSGSGDITVTTA
jgi:hypothetical protein